MEISNLGMGFEFEWESKYIQYDIEHIIFGQSPTNEKERRLEAVPHFLF